MKCAYCEETFCDFYSYKLHLKVFHNKNSYGDKLLCGQNSCPRDFSRFQTLCAHITNVHGSVVSSGSESCNHDDSDMDVSDYTIDDSTQILSTACVASSSRTDRFVEDEISSDNVFHNAAHFVTKLRSNLKIPSCSIAQIIADCKDMLSCPVSSVRHEVQSIGNDFDIPQERLDSLLKVIDVLENPFHGIESSWNHCKYLTQNGYFVEPQTFLIDSVIVSGTGESSCKVKKLTGEFVSTRKVLEKVLCLPGVLQHVQSRSDASMKDTDIIGDFVDGQLWREHPVRLLHCNEQNAIVIPVFDFFDDLETANALGSHAVVHKIGVKYTIVKSFSPAVNTKLENLFLNMIFKSSDRTARDILGIYIHEMTELESKGFTLTLPDGKQYQVYVVVVQLAGDNLGLNGLLGFVESFTANYPCRLCKVARASFDQTYVEQSHLLRTPESYETDIHVNNPGLTGIKEPSVYNDLPSFHVTSNVFCDIMHDIAEGVARYLMALLLNSFIFKKKYFSLEQLNVRLIAHVYDHSCPPPPLTAEHIKNLSLNLSAAEMINLVLGLNLMIGDLIPVDDVEWEVYLMFRMIVLYCFGIVFSTEELQYLQIIIAEFLQEYRSVFGASLTLKFHNMTHYPRIIKMLGPLYHIWVMRCEGKHSELKKVAHTSGSYKNICKTLAVRHQLKQSERFMSQRSFDDINYVHIPGANVDCIVLADLPHGSKVSDLLGSYGLFREIFTVTCITVGAIYYSVNDVLVSVDSDDDLLPNFLMINSIFLTDDRNCRFMCTSLLAVTLSHHYQAYEVVPSDSLVMLKSENLQDLPSPWPLKSHFVNSVQYISLRHKI